MAKSKAAQSTLLLVGIGAVAVGLAAARPRRPVYSYGGPDWKNGKGEWLSRDPSKLLPSFAARLEVLFQRMRARGFDPMLHEGYRTPERAGELAVEGVGSKRSLHCHGAAADIISAKHKWSSPAFFAALGEEARKLRLVWGGDWDNDGKREPGEDDLPHVQAVPTTPEWQNAVRNAPSLAAADRVARRYYG